MNVPLHQNRMIRRILMPLFERFNPGEISISHPLTGDRFHLHSFKHRGYWFHGKKREAETTEFFRQLISRGQTVVEVGGHIGFVTLLFASLVGPSGRVVVFEPGENNLPFLRKNVASKSNVNLVEKAAGEIRQSRPFYLEDLTGQNNSLTANFRMVEVNRAAAFTKTEPREVIVEVVPVDDVVRELGLRPSFIKIDVEGHEYPVLLGLGSTVEQYKPRLMVEILIDAPKVLEWLRQRGYRCFDEAGSELDGENPRSVNTFCIHRDDLDGFRAIGRASALLHR